MSAYGSFHGRTLATLHATGQPAKHEAFQPLPEGFRHVTWLDLDELEAALAPSVAAVLLEPVQGEGGVNPATTEYFQGVRRLCDERGRPVHGRRGADRARPLRRAGSPTSGSGSCPTSSPWPRRSATACPIGACWAKAEVAAVFEPGDHATTYGGQPLATAAARAVLAVMEAEDVPARAERAGDRLRVGPRGAPGGRRGARARAAPGRRARGPRQQGGRRPPARARGHRQRRSHPTALRLAPSLLITDDEIDHAVALLSEALA